MTNARNRTLILFALMGLLLLLEGTVHWQVHPLNADADGYTILSGSWNVVLEIVLMCLLSAIMALGVNLQWGYAGLFSTGIVGFVALGGLAGVLVSLPPVTAVWNAAGVGRLVVALLTGLGVIGLAVFAYGHLKGRARTWGVTAILVGGFFLYRAIFDPAVAYIEANDPAAAGNIGGLGLPALVAWPAGALMAAAAAWAIGKTALGLRSDYLAIATLGIGEIIVAVMKNEDWLDRGVKNATQIPRPWPVPTEVSLQESQRFLDFCANWGLNPVNASTIAVQLLYALLFTAVLLLILWACELALNSPWGRMMRAIRDNETASGAMGKDVTKRHLQVFILGAAICGLAGAMLVTRDGQLVPSSYTPLRFTFTIWLMVIVGGSGNNWGSVLGAFLIWYLWNKVFDWGSAAMWSATQYMDPASSLKAALTGSAEQMRTIVMGVILLVVLRFAPKGLLPEK